LYVAEEFDQETKLSLTQVDATLRNLRVTFLVPGLKNVLRYYVGLMTDLSEVPKAVAAEFQLRYPQPAIVEEEKKDQ